MSSQSKVYDLVTFGEAMIRFAPAEISAEVPDDSSMFMLRTVGGDELNVCVDLSRLDGTNAKWVSVLPEGPMGDVIYQCGSKAGVDMSACARVPNADVGIFTVLPEQKTVHYQRRNSAFAKHDTKIFDWEKLLAPGPNKKWLHITGITPQISPAARLSWSNALQTAEKLGVPVSMDFNHRKQLGTLDDLWSLVLPQLSRLQILILSVESMIEIAQLESIATPARETPMDDVAWRQLMSTLRGKWQLKRLAVCFKSRNAEGLQRRWSCIADASGVHSSMETPVFHKPKDECGGGSAWAAGILDCFFTGLLAVEEEAPKHAFRDIYDSKVARAARRADLSAALCQESPGDHSQVTRAELSHFEGTYAGSAVDLTVVKKFGQADTHKTADKSALLDETLELCKKAGVLAILRAKNPDVAIERGLELCKLGCRALEVTLDTTEWRRVLKTLSSSVPKNVCVGVGTVMEADLHLMPEIAALGARFALSPINPRGFIKACHDAGVLAVPAGMTSNELWSMHLEGAKLIKLFHGSMVGPKVLKAMLQIGPLSVLNIAPSGGCSPQNVAEWWDAGALVVGMGSNLAGSDINFPTGSEEFKKARKEWEDSGKAVAAKLFAEIERRFP